MTRYVGIDVGKHRCRAALMDQKGEIVDEFLFQNSNEGISQLESMLTQEDRVRNSYRKIYIKCDFNGMMKCYTQKEMTPSK